MVKQSIQSKSNSINVLDYLKTSASSQNKPDNFFEKNQKHENFTFKQEKNKFIDIPQFYKAQHEKVNSLNGHNNIAIASIEDKFLGEELNMKLRGIKEKTRNAYYTLGLNKNSLKTTKDNQIDSIQSNKTKLFDTFEKQLKQSSISKVSEEKNLKLGSFVHKDVFEKNSLLKSLINKNISISSKNIIYSR